MNVEIISLSLDKMPWQLFQKVFIPISYKSCREQIAVIEEKNDPELTEFPIFEVRFCHNLTFQIFL